jgi:hypothetical protein
LPLVVLTSAVSPTDNGTNQWAQTPCNNNNNNNKRGIVVGSNDTIVPLVGNWATSTCNPSPTQTTTATATKATWEGPTPTSVPVQSCNPANTNLWSWSDYLYCKR